MARFIINPKVNNTLGLMDVITVPQGGTGVTVAGSVPGVFNAFVGSDLNTANGPIGLDGNGKIPVQYFPTGAGGVLIYDSNGFVPSSAISPSSGVGVFTGITGPSSVVVGETVTYTITNYDSFMNYNVTVSGGSVSVSGNLIAFTAPNTTGTVTLTLNGKTSSIPVIASRVNAPVITAPGNNAEGVSLKPTFTKSSFSVTGQAQTQTSVRWELSTDSAFTTLVDYYEGASNYTSWAPSVTLSSLTTYYVRVKDQGSISGYSTWSPVVSFTTVQQVNFVAALSGTGTNGFYGIVKLNGYLYAVGTQSSQGQGSNDALIAKYDLNGNLIWQKSLGGSGDDQFHAITTDGAYLYAAGYQASQGQGSNDALIAKYDLNGNLIWQKSLGGGSGDQFDGITFDSGYLYAVGLTWSVSGMPDIFTTKFDTNGNLIWQRSLNYLYYDFAFTVTVLNGFVYVTGPYAPTGQANGDGFLVKYDTNGNLIWQRGFGSSSGGGEWFVGSTTDGTYIYLTGNVAGGGGVSVVKYDTNGNLIWQRSLGGMSDGLGRAITYDGTNLYVVGMSGANGTDAIIFKCDTNGNLIWQLSLSGSGSDIFYDIKTDGNYLYIVGSSSSLGSSSTSAILAIVPTSGSINLGALPGNGLTGLSWKSISYSWSTIALSNYSGSFSSSGAALTPYTPALIAYTPTLPVLYSNF